MELTHRLVSSRPGAGALAAVAAIAAGALVLVYLSQYRSSVDEGAAPATVLVADQTIRKGTAGDVVLKSELFQREELRTEDVAGGAVVDASAIRGKVATRDIYPGEQLVLADFAGSADAVSTRLTGAERAVAVPLDAAHALADELEAGDHVDVLAGFNLQNLGVGTARPLVRVLLQDVPVLSVAKQPNSGTGNVNVVLQVGAADAAALAFTVENGKIWLVLRPRAGAPRTKQVAVTAESLLVGVKPVAVGGN